MTLLWRSADSPTSGSTANHRERVARLPTPSEAVAPETLVEVFAATVAAFPDFPALDDGIRTLTYAQLAAAADCLAGELVAEGIGRGDRVGIRVPSGGSDLYVAILAVILAGGAYVPVDFDDPESRARMIWEAAEVSAVVTEGLRVEPRRPGHAVGGRTEPEDDCWIIFTSGSTGAPKAVAVTHRAATAFVDAEAALWTISPEDRVLASLSVGFDASCEEMWLAWRNGATLVPCPRAVVQAGIDLGPWLEERAVSVVSTVPTLAALWEEDVLVGVRLLILGGEACPTDLAWRLAAAREVWNTYGPTEATVVSTAARIAVGEHVSIGRPLRGWQVAVVDPQGVPVPTGAVGELVISGVGLGRYLDAELDRARYRALPALGWARAYRTGDMVREAGDGLEFVGRTDDQVKIGGRRIELGEIEAQLASCPGVLAAAVVVRTSESANPTLVGYVVGDVDPAEVRQAMAQRLPEGIVPFVVRIGALPTRSNGKLDRSALPWPPPEAVDAADRGPAEELTATERWLADAWIAQLGPRAIEVGSDFFALGGSSIAAAKLASALRVRYPAIAVADLYRHRRLRDLARHLEHLDAPRIAPSPPPRTRHRWGVAQLVGVGVLLVLGSVQWLIGILAYNEWFGTGARPGWIVVVVGWLIFSSAVGRAGIVIAARRCLLGRMRPGRYRRQGWLAVRIGFVERLSAALHIEVLAGTPWTARYARINGVEVGAGARLATLPSPTGLLSIGAGATLEGDVDCRSWWIDGPDLVVAPVVIGAHARIGARALLMPGAVVGEGAEIEPGSVVTGMIPEGERWSGSPARHVGVAGEQWPSDPEVSGSRPRLQKPLFAFGLVVLSLLPLLAGVPAIGLLGLLGALGSVHAVVRTVLVDAPAFAGLYLLSYALLTAVAVRSAARGIRPGWHVDHGTVGWSLWFTDAVLARSRETLFPLYASVYTRAWLRLLGIAVGPRSEVSTAVGLNHLTNIGATSFVADDVVFSPARSRGGLIEVRPVAVGDRTFLGNGAILRSATRVGNDSLVGILSSPPRTSADGTSWFGLPPLELARVAERGDPARTTSPPRRLVVARGAFELVRIFLPTTVSALLGIFVFSTLERIGDAAGILALVGTAPAVLACASGAAVAVTIVAKWTLIGRYRAGDHPIWSFFVWRDELVNTLQEQLAGAWLLERSLATPLIPAYLRAMGARVGAGTWIECLNVTEFDLVDIGTGCNVNRGACIDTHLVHDRILRMGPATLGAGSTLGPESAVLPDTTLGDGCTVGGRSVVMRGETLPSHSCWHGIPVQSA
jgi:non-ribosomal peptide synthetase-like protein